MRKILFSLFVLILLVPSISFSQSDLDQVYLQNGEVYSGKIVAIGSQIILIKGKDQVFSIDRSKVKYVFRPTKSYSPKSQPAEFQFMALDKRLITELNFGLHTFSPFVVAMGLTEWIKLNEKWTAGFGLSLNFSNYMMAKFNTSIRRIRPYNQSLKTFVGIGAGIAAGAGTFINNNWAVDRTAFSPVFQSNLGAGILFDTGYMFGFSLEAGISAFRLNVTETYYLGTPSQIISKSQLFNLGPYFQAGLRF